MGNFLDTQRKEREWAQESVYVRQIIEAREKLTGWERIKLIFTVNEYSELSPEIQRVLMGTTCGIITGGFIGSMGRGRIAYQDFMRSNAHEVFETPLEARRKLQDRVTIGMGSGAFRVGWRVGAFTGMYLIVATLISTYRGKMGILDQVVGGGAAGLIYKFQQGPKAAFAGGVIGSLLGLSAGIMTAGITKLTGDTIDSANLRYYKHLAVKDESAHADRQGTRDLLYQVDRDIWDPAGDKFELTKYHDRLVKKMDETDVDPLKQAYLTSQPGKVSSQEDNEKVNVTVSQKDNVSEAPASKSVTKS